MDWYGAVSAAKPILLMTIEFLIHTKRLAPYSKALRLLSIAVNQALADSDDDVVVAAVRKTQKQLTGLNAATPAKGRAVLKKLKTQIAEL